jgi:hypothetical protein
MLKPMFSRRTSFETEPNALTRALARERSAGRPLLDLTVSNPTRVGLRYPPEFYATLIDQRSAAYEPEPLGLESARRAVAGYASAGGGDLAPECVWLCASTSEAYAYLLALLCDPGDAVLVPRPGYPLLDWVADLSGVRLVPYPIRYDGGWWLDAATLRAALAREERARAIVAIAPGNPTGHYLAAGELRALEELCRERELALLVDEVFSDYPLREDAERVAHTAGPRRCLTFVLSGLSKLAALPQLKLAWGLACGPGADAALERLAFVADAFLSAATPVQLALPAILAAAPGMQERIRARTRANLDALRRELAGTPLALLDAEGGWSAILRLPALPDWSDERFALRLLERTGVLVQPGALFDLEGCHAVVSLLCEPETLACGVRQIARETEALLA